MHNNLPQSIHTIKLINSISDDFEIGSDNLQICPPVSCLIIKGNFCPDFLQRLPSSIKKLCIYTKLDNQIKINSTVNIVRTLKCNQGLIMMDNVCIF